jgi:hypothetical protein
MKEKRRTEWLIQWRRPQDDSWLYNIPSGKFSNESELKKHLKKHTETPGVEFRIICPLDK